MKTINLNLTKLFKDEEFFEAYDFVVDLKPESGEQPTVRVLDRATQKEYFCNISTDDRNIVVSVTNDYLNLHAIIDIKVLTHHHPDLADLIFNGDTYKTFVDVLGHVAAAYGITLSGIQYDAVQYIHKLTCHFKDAKGKTATIKVDILEQYTNKSFYQLTIMAERTSDGCLSEKQTVQAAGEDVTGEFTTEWKRPFFVDLATRIVREIVLNRS